MKISPLKCAVVLAVVTAKSAYALDILGDAGSLVGFGQSRPFLAGAVALAIVSSAMLIWVLRSSTRRRMAHNDFSVETLAEWSPQEFSRLVAEALRLKGCAVDEVSSQVGNGQTQLVMWRNGRKVLVYCRQARKTPVSLEELRALRYGAKAIQASSAALINCGRFGKDAQAYAQKTGIQLVDGPRLLELVRNVQLPVAQLSAAAESIEDLPQELPPMFAEPVATEESFEEKNLRVKSEIATRVASRLAMRKMEERPSVKSEAFANTEINTQVMTQVMEPEHDEAQEMLAPIEHEYIEHVPSPACPRCQSPMQSHVADSGRAAGIRYWLCKRYPDCTGTRPA